MTHGAPVRRKDPEDDGNNSSEEFPPPPDGGWGWMVVLASFLIHIITDGMTYSFGIFYVEFLKYFGEGKGYTAWIVSLLVGVTLCSGPISSSFVNRYGCRAVTIAGAILASFFIFISMFAQNVLTLIFTIGIGTGMGFGLIYLPAIVCVTMYFEKRRSLATGIAVCGSGFGTFVFAPLTTSLVSEYGWRGSMLVISAIVLNCIIFGIMFRPLEPVPKPKLDNSKVVELQPLNKGSTFLEIPEESEEPLNDTSNRLRSFSVGHDLPRVTKNNNNHLNGQVKPIESMTTSHPHLYVTSSRRDLSKSLSTSGTMDRPDVFYQGSLANIPYYRSKTDLSRRNSNRYGSISNERKIASSHEDSATVLGCVPCSPEAKDTFEKMMNFSLFSDGVFIIFVVSNFCTSIGFNVPYVYIAAQAEEQGLDPTDASYLLSVIGIANTLGRIILGYLSDKTWVNRLLVYNVCLTVCGLATALSVYCHDFTSLAFYSSVFGFTIGAYVGLTSVILVDLLGLEKLTNAFGLLLLFQGIASLVGPPFAGWLYDITGSYNPGFILSGATIAASGIVLFAIPPLQAYRVRKEEALNKRTVERGLTISS